MALGRSTSIQIAIWYRQLADKGFKHWLIAIGLIILGIYAGDEMQSHQFFMAARYYAYQLLHDYLRASNRIPDRTIIVEIRDDEYWEGELAHRQPISRVYLAKLLRKLDEFEPAVIAIDFDLRSPVPDGTLRDNKEYKDETAQLVAAIKMLADKQRQIVLPTTIWADLRGDYIEDSEIYDSFLETGSTIRKGYINLPYDTRMVPMPIQISSGTNGRYWLDSFGIAIAKALDSRAVPSSIEGKLPYGHFVSRDRLNLCQCVYSSSAILKAAANTFRPKFHPRAVIIGGAWHKLAEDRGDIVDTFLTPVGSIGGPYIHSNYVESILSQDHYPPVAKIAVEVIEIVGLMMLAVMFGLEFSGWIKTVLFLLACMFLVFLSYVLLQNFGVFLDPVLPVLALLGHTAVDKIVEWRERAVAYRTMAGLLFAFILILTTLGHKRKEES